MIRLFYEILSEIVLILLYPIAFVTLQINTKNLKQNEIDGPTIVIVERWLSLNIRHLYWRRYLRKNGFNVHLVNFPLWQKDFEHSSYSLNNYMEEREIKNATLVGISSGAITCLLYLQERDGWSRVKNFVSVGSPFEGTWMMLILSYLKSGRELLPGSALTQKIKNMDIVHIDRITCMRAKFDEMVPNGAILPHANAVTVNIFGHNNLHIRNKSTYKVISNLAS